MESPIRDGDDIVDFQRKISIDLFIGTKCTVHFFKIISYGILIGLEYKYFFFKFFTI